MNLVEDAQPASEKIASFMDELTAYISSIRSKGDPFHLAQLTWMVLANGDADYHDSVILFGFEGTNLEPTLVVKAPRMPENDWMLRAEYDRLVEMWGLLKADASLFLPEPIAFIKLRGQSALVISYIQGESLIRQSRRKFWRDTEQVRHLGVEVARSLRSLNDKVSTPLANEEQVISDLRNKAKIFEHQFTLSANETLILKDLVECFEAETKKAQQKVLIQGDFWHGNLIRESKNNRLMFVDWQFARWSVDVSLDVYLFLMAGALTATGNETSVNKAHDTAEILFNWQSTIIPAYLEAYGKPDGYILLPPKFGMLLCCVEKAIRPRMELGYDHPDDMVWRMIFRELQKWPERYIHA